MLVEVGTIGMEGSAEVTNDLFYIIRFIYCLLVRKQQTK